MLAREIALIDQAWRWTKDTWADVDYSMAKEAQGRDPSPDDIQF